MNIQDYWRKINPENKIAFDERGEVVKFPLIRKLWLTLLIILVGALGFGLGKLSNLNQNTEITIEYQDIDKTQNTETKAQINPNTSTNSLEAVVVSSKGSRYYYSWCKNTISEKNKVTFATALLAEKAGYTLATNCKTRQIAE